MKSQTSHNGGQPGRADGDQRSPVEKLKGKALFCARKVAELISRQTYARIEPTAWIENINHYQVQMSDGHMFRFTIGHTWNEKTGRYVDAVLIAHDDEEYHFLDTVEDAQQEIQSVIDHVMQQLETIRETRTPEPTRRPA